MCVCVCVCVLTHTCLLAAQKTMPLVGGNQIVEISLFCLPKSLDFVFSQYPFPFFDKMLKMITENFTRYLKAKFKIKTVIENRKF